MQYRRVTDGQTDEQTELLYRYRALHGCAVLARDDNYWKVTGA